MGTPSIDTVSREAPPTQQSARAALTPWTKYTLHGDAHHTGSQVKREVRGKGKTCPPDLGESLFASKYIFSAPSTATPAKGGRPLPQSTAHVERSGAIRRLSDTVWLPLFWTPGDSFGMPCVSYIRHAERCKCDRREASSSATN